MIYCIEPEYYPTREQFIEEEKYLDENDFQWRIARVKAGIIIRYFGYPYFDKGTQCRTQRNTYHQPRAVKTTF